MKIFKLAFFLNKNDNIILQEPIKVQKYPNQRVQQKLSIITHKKTLFQIYYFHSNVIQTTVEKYQQKNVIGFCENVIFVVSAELINHSQIF